MFTLQPTTGFLQFLLLVVHVAPQFAHLCLRCRQQVLVLSQVFFQNCQLTNHITVTNSKFSKLASVYWFLKAICRNYHIAILVL